MTKLTSKIVKAQYEGVIETMTRTTNPIGWLVELKPGMVTEHLEHFIEVETLSQLVSKLETVKEEVKETKPQRSYYRMSLAEAMDIIKERFTGVLIDRKDGEYVLMFPEEDAKEMKFKNGFALVRKAKEIQTVVPGQIEIEE